MVELDVLLNDRHVAVLRETRKGARLVFDADVVEGYRGLPLLSASLPVKARPYGEGLTNAWFENLLPEGARLERLCRELGCAPTDYVRILAKIGWECAGAVAIVDPESQPLAQKDALRPLPDAELATRLAGLPRFDAESALAMRVSLGGFQEKMLVSSGDVVFRDGLVSQGSFCLPAGAALSTHILKPQLSSRYPGLIEAEAWAMAVASRAARCAKTALLRIDGAPTTLVVERFDRARRDGALVRVHQEDCCQALGLPPSGKYASARVAKGDDPSYVGIARVLAAFADCSDAELAELLRQMTVNFVLGNTDAHAKNYALLYRGLCSPTLSPLYDVTPSCDIEPGATHLSLRINGKVAIGEVGRDDVLDEAMSWGVSAEAATQALDETLDSILEGLEAAASFYPSAAQRYADAALSRLGKLR